MPNKWARRWRAIKTDGCTAVPGLWLLAACRNHDRMYATHRDKMHIPITRAKADWLFFQEARKANPKCPIASTIIASIYYLGVRVFGAAFWDQKYQEPPP